MEQDEAKITKKPWYKSWWGIIILILFWPFSLSYFIWTKKSFSKKVKLVLLVGLWILVGILMSSGSPENTRISSEEETKSPAAVSPSPLASETTTPSSSPSPSPKFTLKEDPAVYIKYSQDMQEIFRDQADASDTMSKIISKWPNLSNQDVIQLAAATVILEKTYDRAVAINPPEELESAHTKYVASYKLVKDAMPLYRQGLDKLDSTLISQANSKIFQATALNKEATDEVNQFTETVKGAFNLQ